MSRDDRQKRSMRLGGICHRIASAPMVHSAVLARAGGFRTAASADGDADAASIAAEVVSVDAEFGGDVVPIGPSGEYEHRGYPRSVLRCRCSEVDADAAGWVASQTSWAMVAHRCCGNS